MPRQLHIAGGGCRVSISGFECALEQGMPARLPHPSHDSSPRSRLSGNPVGNLSLSPPSRDLHGLQDLSTLSPIPYLGLTEHVAL